MQILYGIHSDPLGDHRGEFTLELSDVDLPTDLERAAYLAWVGTAWEPARAERTKKS
ncbi:MAG: hypothetical protein WAN74_04425 [Thermoplasmata archaeon]